MVPSSRAAVRDTGEDSLVWALSTTMGTATAAPAAAPLARWASPGLRSQTEADLCTYCVQALCRCFM